MEELEELKQRYAIEIIELEQMRMAHKKACSETVKKQNELATSIRHYRILNILIVANLILLLVKLFWK